ncbi:MAG: hypothetical protein RL434_896 [Pseudomonadota bacterium]|jgi:carbamate kinase
MPERMVVALGGNALVRKGDQGTAPEQSERARAAMQAISPLLTSGIQMVITHGNGPTVGAILLRQQLAQGTVPPMPLDVCGAESQGGIGYFLERALREVTQLLQPQRPVATLLSMVEVAQDDAAFQHPTKPVGPWLSAEEAAALAPGLALVHEDDRGWRRVVPSPNPRRILNLDAIKALLDADALVITLGGGGVPVARDANQQLRGVEGVIDKDLSSSLLARELGASTLLILTDIDAVYQDFRGARRPLLRMHVAEAEHHLANGEFLTGSMAPKIEAAVAFLRAGGQRVLIGLPEMLSGLLSGTVGTTVLP